MMLKIMAIIWVLALCFLLVTTIVAYSQKPSPAVTNEGTR